VFIESGSSQSVDMTFEETSAAIASTLSNLARRRDVGEGACQIIASGLEIGRVQLPGLETIAKTMLEQELSALTLRIQILEARANAVGSQKLPITPNEPEVSPPLSVDDLNEGPTESSHKHAGSGLEEVHVTIINTLLAGNSNGTGQIGEYQSNAAQLTDEQLGSIRNHVIEQAEQIKSQKEFIEIVGAQLQQQQKQTERAVHGLENGMEDVGAIKRELLKHQQANLAFQKALREIGNIVTAVAQGDLSKKVLVHDKELDPEITTFKRTINKMVDQLQDFASQVTHLAKEVGTEGRLGQQCELVGVSGIWAELTSNGG